MKLQLEVISSGPLDNNAVLVHHPQSRQGVIIDPSFNPEQLQDRVKQLDLSIPFILFTHGHFDHFAGLSYLLSNLSSAPRVGLHPSDLKLWSEGGGSVQFRMPLFPPVEPAFALSDKQEILLGEEKIQVRHTPGHSPGSVVFYLPSLQAAVVGDLIFRHSVGRTDLEDGDFAALQHSIETQVFTLPLETVLIPGHGAQTTIAEEMNNNPFIGSKAIY